jgi:Protein of unknown function (DUF3987)
MSNGDQPTLTVNEDGVTLSFPGDAYILDFHNMTRGKYGGFNADVTARHGEQALHVARIDLLDQRQQEAFHQRCASMNGSINIDWQSRIQTGLLRLRDLPEQGPIPAHVTEPPKPFPLDALPDVLAKFVQTCAAALPCPPDFLAVPLLAVLGAAIGTTHVIEIKPGWRESPSLWTAVVADPGSKKSPALDLVLRPLYRAQQRFKQAYAEDMDAYELERAEYDKNYAAWKREKGRTVDSIPAKPHEPGYQQLFSTDATTEALAGVLEQNPRGTLFVRDELTGWARGMNQYKGGKGSDRQTWLSFWNGATVLVNRKSRKEPITIDKPFVAVTGCLPPEVLGELTDERGREDGFLHRLLFAFPAPRDIAWTEENIPSTAQDDYAAVVEKLQGLQWGSKGAEDAEDAEDAEECAPRVLTLTREGKAEWVTWVTSHYAELNSPDLPSQLRGPWSKLEGYCARLALVLHLARLACGEVKNEAIDKVSVAGAWSLVDYFKSHARLVYAQLHASPEEKRLEAARQWIRRHSGAATVRDLYRYKVAGCATLQEAQTLLDALVRHGYGTVVDEVPPTGGHRRKVFRAQI